jgi:hypothetical protein
MDLGLSVSCSLLAALLLEKLRAVAVGSPRLLVEATLAAGALSRGDKARRFPLRDAD